MINKFKQRKKQSKLNWKRSILSAIESFKDYKLSSVDEYKKVVPQNPLSHKNAEQFMENVKNNNISKVKSMLEITPNLAYEFDERYQTALHWCAKRGYVKLI